MAKKRTGRRLEAYMNGLHVGTWEIGSNGIHMFAYADSWLTDPQARPISLSMPIRPSNEPYRGSVVESFFDNLLPDNQAIRQRILSRFGTASTQAFDLLYEIGRDCIGAIQLVDPDADSNPGRTDVRQIIGKSLTNAEVAAELQRTTAAMLPGQPQDDQFRISLAGAQEKTALLWHKNKWHKPEGPTPSTHIFKLPMGRVGHEQIDLSTSIENEWLCAQIIQAYGIDVAKCKIARFKDQKALVVERFDRRLSSDKKWWIRLPQEDMCQATGTPPAQKYESDGGPGIQSIMSLLLGSRLAEKDRTTFFKTQILFWMLCAPDGHAKNFSVRIEPEGRYSLTPLYDVISAYPYIGRGANKIARQKTTLAMAFTGKNRHYKWSEITARHIMQTAKNSGFSAKVDATIEELVSMTENVVEQVAKTLPRNFPNQVASSIFDGLKKSTKKLEK